MMIFLLWLVFSILIGVWGSNRGRSGVGYGLLALLISPLLAFLILLVIGPNRDAIESDAISSGELRKCPHCAELVKAEAKLCRYCHSELPRGIFQP